MILMKRLVRAVVRYLIHHVTVWLGGHVSVACCGLDTRDDNIPVI